VGQQFSLLHQLYPSRQSAAHFSPSTALIISNKVICFRWCLASFIPPQRPRLDAFNPFLVSKLIIFDNKGLGTCEHFEILLWMFLEQSHDAKQHNAALHTRSYL
jgi:hypothetical protein